MTHPRTRFDHHPEDRREDRHGRRPVGFGPTGAPIPQTRHRIGARRTAAVLAAYHAQNAERARVVITALVRAGYHVGPVPFGYRAHRLADAPGDGPNRGRRRIRLTIEPVEAATVAMIFTWCVTDGLSRTQITQRLIAARYPAPLHPVTGQPMAWSQPIVTAILRNPAYTGRTVWGRSHDGQPIPPTRWVFSKPGAHVALINDDMFLAAEPSPRHRTELVVAWSLTRTTS